MAKGKVSKKTPTAVADNRPELSDVVFKLAVERIEYYVHYPSDDSAVVTIGGPETPKGKGLNGDQLLLIGQMGGHASADMTIRIICHNG